MSNDYFLRYVAKKGLTSKEDIQVNKNYLTTSSYFPIRQMISTLATHGADLNTLEI